MKLPRLPDLQPETYDNDDLRAIHAAIRSERDELMFHLFAFAGLRRGELAALSWQQVDLDHWQLRLIGKGSKFRLVPLHPVLQELLRDRQSGAVSIEEPVVAGAGRGPLEAVTLGRHTRTLVDRAGVQINSPCHAFRRTVATVMYEAGVRTRVIEKIMGWAPRQMHDRHYLRVADETMREAILTLYRDDPITDRQRPTLAPQPVAAPTATTGSLEQEAARLAALEARLGIDAA